MRRQAGQTTLDIRQGYRPEIPGINANVTALPVARKLAVRVAVEMQGTFVAPGPNTHRVVQQDNLCPVDGNLRHGLSRCPSRRSAHILAVMVSPDEVLSAG